MLVAELLAVKDESLYPVICDQYKSVATDRRDIPVLCPTTALNEFHLTSLRQPHGKHSRF